MMKLHFYFLSWLIYQVLVNKQPLYLADKLAYQTRSRTIITCVTTCFDSIKIFSKLKNYQLCQEIWTYVLLYTVYVLWRDNGNCLTKIQGKGSSEWEKGPRYYYPPKTQINLDRKIAKEMYISVPAK